MSRRMGAAIAWMGLLLAFQIYGVAALIRNETPRASLFGVAISDQTGQPIPHAHITLTRIEYVRDEQDRFGYYRFYYNVYEVRADAQGRFSLRGIPAGRYELRAGSEAHHFPAELSSGDRPAFEIELSEGEREELTLRMEPDRPFVELIHPQAVYYPGEAVRLGVRGFAPTDEVEVALYRLKSDIGSSSGPAQQRSLTDFVRTLSEIRYGWWRDEWELRNFLQASEPYLNRLSELVEPIRGRDPEGVFTQYLSLPNLERGVYLAVVRAGPAIRPALLIISHAGLIAKVVGSELEVWAIDLKSGQPLPNLPVAVASLYQQASRQSRFVQGRTGSDGRWRVSQAPPGELLIMASDPDRKTPIVWFTFWRWDDGSESGADLYGAIYTERPIYRPGDTIYFKGIVRRQQPSAQSLYQPLRAGTPVQITVYDPDDEPVAQQTLRLSDFSSFSGSFETTPESRTGLYRIVALVEGERIEGEAEVAAYRKPVYRINLKPSRELYLPGERVEVEIRSEYYFGMPVPNARLRYEVARSYDYYGYDDSDGAEWEDDWSVPPDADEEALLEGGYGYYGERVASGEAQTDEQGRAILRIPVSELLKESEREGDFWWYAFERPTAYRCTLRVEMLSEGAEFAQATTRFSVASTYWQVRMQVEPYFGKPNQPYTVRLQVRDRRTGAPVHTRLNWRVGERLRRGDRFVTSTAFEGTVATDAQGRAQFDFTPPYAGDWEIRIEGRDSEGYPLILTDTLWVWHSSRTPQTPPEARLDLRVNRNILKAGEPLEIAIRAGQPDATLWLTLEGDRIYHSQIVSLRNGVATVRLTPPIDAIPNAFVKVCMVQNKRYIERVRVVKIGVHEQNLKIAIQTDKSRYAPRETVHAQITVTDADGRPARAELSLAVVDESIYAIRSDTFRLKREFYAYRWNRVRTEFSAPWLALQGDKGQAELEIRRTFRDTAFWTPAALTDAQGVARIAFPLPDNLTEWRLTVHAHTLQTQVGYAKASIKCAKDLMVNLRMPLWLVEGDRTRISTVISNDTAQPRELEVILRTPDGARQQTAAIGAHKTLTLHWDYTARGYGKQTFQAIVRDRATGLTDAEERTVTLMPFALRRSFGQTAWLTRPRELTLTVAPDAILPVSQLQVQVVPSVLHRIYHSLPYLIDYPYGCVEQTTSRFLPAVLALHAFQQMGITPPADMQRQIATVARLSIERLRRFQQENGGWGWWEGERPNLWTTAYVMRALHLAKQAGVRMPDTMYDEGRQSLIQLINQGLEEWEKRMAGTSDDSSIYISESELLYGLYMLCQIETEPPVKRALLNRFVQRCLTEIAWYDSEEAYCLLILYLRWRLPDRESAIARLWQRLLKTAHEEQSLMLWYRTEEDARWWDYRSWYGWLPALAQSEALLALLASEPYAEKLFGTRRRYEELIRKTVMGLLRLAQGDGWYTSLDTAHALEALLAFSRRYESAGALAKTAQVQVWLNGTLAGEVRVNPGDAWKAAGRLTLDVGRLQPGENRIELRPIGGSPIVSLQFEQWVRLTPASATPPSTFKIKVSRLESVHDLTASITCCDGGWGNIELTELQSGDSVAQGSLILVEVEAKVSTRSREASYLVLETPYFAGCVPTELASDSIYYWNDWVYQRMELRDDRAISYRSRLSASEEMHYRLLLRAEVPGEYRLLPPRLWAMYAPYDEHGASFILRVR